MSTETTFHADEHTPLVGDDSLDLSASNTDTSTSNGRVPIRTQLVAILFVCVLYFDVYVCPAPETSIREEIICKTYYNRLDKATSATDPAELDCTVDDVQKELNLVNQVYVTLTQIPGFLLALPYGILGTGSLDRFYLAEFPQ
ncbi:hypothetical protein AAFC00_001606 [Neodothiora populina]|uniref:Uncharacterized protein n=1 Tax=Neodothiora populina TaxID=2781224 RepID=A0ABR3PPG7_9PEZI